MAEACEKCDGLGWVDDGCACGHCGPSAYRLCTSRPCADCRGEGDVRRIVREEMARAAPAKPPTPVPDLNPTERGNGE